MQTEIEAKFLNVDHDEMRKKLEALGATCEQPMRMMRRKNFDYEDLKLEHVGGWVRVRDEGEKTTLAYKQLNDRTLHGTQEVSLTVSDFETTCQFLQAIGLVQQSYQETKRESWVLGEVQIELDEWPWIPTFLEMEGPDEVTLRDLAQKLELDWEQAVHGSVEVAYQAVYKVTEEEIDHWREITFCPVPDWLEKTRKS